MQSVRRSERIQYLRGRDFSQECIYRQRFFAYNRNYCSVCFCRYAICLNRRGRLIRYEYVTNRGHSHADMGMMTPLSPCNLTAHEYLFARINRKKRAIESPVSIYAFLIRISDWLQLETIFINQFLIRNIQHALRELFKRFEKCLSIFSFSFYALLDYF